MVLENEGISEPTEISIVLSDDATIWELNKRFLNHDYPTDVLSFPLSGELPLKYGRESLVGEIVIGVETAERNARRYQQTLEEELIRLALHGTLHLLGYDDKTESQKRKMRRKEREYLMKLGFER